MTSLHGEVASDLKYVNDALRSHGLNPRQLFPPNVAMTAFDILVDAAMVVICVLATIKSNWLFLPIALVVIGSRQRSIGNLLHDASHGAISKSRLVNDALGTALLGPLALVDFRTYRARHNRHHRYLGLSQDPDRIQGVPESSRGWYVRYWKLLTNHSVILDSAFGHLPAADVNPARRLAILLWWCLALVGLGAVLGEEFARAFVVIWLLSRISTFHAITTFREMCDHYGLSPGGIFAYARDFHGPFVVRVIMHPRNNGWHLTHHLLPMTPYRFLPDARNLLDSVLLDRQLSSIRGSYFLGFSPVTREWDEAQSIFERRCKQDPD